MHCFMESCRLGIPGNADNRASAGSTVDGFWIALTTRELQLSNLLRRRCLLVTQALCCCYYEIGKPQLQKHRPWPQITPCSFKLKITLARDQGLVHTIQEPQTRWLPEESCKD